VETILRWLAASGFKVDEVYPTRTLIMFSGTAGQVLHAFHTSIHYLEVRGKRHIANMNDPQMPAALAPVVGHRIAKRLSTATRRAGLADCSALMTAIKPNSPL